MTRLNISFSKKDRLIILLLDDSSSGIRCQTNVTVIVANFDITSV